MELDVITWLHDMTIKIIYHAASLPWRVSYRSSFIQIVWLLLLYEPSQDMAASLDKDTVSDALPSYSLVLVDNMVIGDVSFLFC